MIAKIGQMINLIDLLRLTTLSSFSWRPVLMVEEAGIPRENNSLSHPPKIG